MTKEEFRQALINISEMSGDSEVMQTALQDLAIAFDNRYDEVERLRGDLTRVEEERDAAQRRYRERFFGVDLIAETPTTIEDVGSDNIRIEDLFKVL